MNELLHVVRLYITIKNQRLKMNTSHHHSDSDLQTGGLQSEIKKVKATARLLAEQT